MKLIIKRKNSNEFVIAIKERVIEGRYSTYFSYKTEYTKDIKKAKIFESEPMSCSGGWWHDHEKLYL